MNSMKFFTCLLLCLLSQAEVINLANTIPKLYITSVDFIISDSKIETNHANIILQDLNEGAGGRYIYPVKSWTFDPKEAITEFQFVQNTVCPSGFIRLEQDLNEGAGGKYNYLCIKRGGGEEPKVTDIDFRSYPYALSTTETNIGGWTLFPRDLNDQSSRRGEYIYLLYKAE